MERVFASSSKLNSCFKTQTCVMMRLWRKKTKKWKWQFCVNGMVISVPTGWNGKTGVPPKVVCLFRKISVWSSRTSCISTGQTGCLQNEDSIAGFRVSWTLTIAFDNPAFLPMYFVYRVCAIKRASLFSLRKLFLLHRVKNNFRFHYY